MDYKFLHKVLDQLVYETRIDYDRKVIETPSLLLSFLSFSTFNPLRRFRLFSLLPPSLFSIHCKEVYGLNDDEIEYVWKEYRETIIDKINNGL